MSAAPVHAEQWVWCRDCHRLGISLQDEPRTAFVSRLHAYGWQDDTGGWVCASCVGLKRG